MNEDQEFTAIGQMVRGDLHLSPKASVYGSIAYFTGGKFKNTLTALAYYPATSPQQVDYTAESTLHYRNISLGVRHFFKGAYNSVDTWNLYGTAGFGLLLGAAENTHSPQVDTALYEKPPLSAEGTGDFRRLTLDLSVGAETQVGGGVFLYAEAKTWLRASTYPSPYLYNQKAPNVAILGVGLRILID